jgi:hypothetical protein
VTGKEEVPDTAVGDVTVEADPRLAFIYQEALRGLLQQQAAVESLHNRAATLIFATAFASSLLGGRALADGLDGASEWLGVGHLFVIGALAVTVLWPYYNLSFRFDAQELLEDYVDRDPRRRCRRCIGPSRCGSKPTGSPTAGSSGA